MHYYQFNIGDYASHTRHLSLIEDAIYRRLLDVYYLHERPLNSGVTTVARQINAKEYEKEVKIILEEFFQLTEKGWENFRADKEIENFHTKIEQASKAGKASAEARLNRRSTSVSTDVQPTNNHKPITINHKPIKNTYTPEGVDISLWNDFLILRKAKKLPITETAIKGLIREGEKAGLNLNQTVQVCCERGWGGFKAEWIVEKPKVGSYENAKDKSRREAMEILTGRRNANESIIDIN